MIIAALDISSFRLDCCILADDRPPVLRNEILGSDRVPLIERVRKVPAAVDLLLWTNRPGYLGGHSPDWVVIEEPAGRFGTRTLCSILGAITASVPAESQIAWRKASEWRHDLGCKNTKDAGHLVVIDALRRSYGMRWEEYNLDEHELDAIGLALAWRKLLAANARGATPGGASITTRASSTGGNT